MRIAALRRWLEPASWTVALFTAASAHGQERGDPVAGRALFTEARRLVAEGSYVEACPKFEESLRLYAGIGTLFNLADCWEHVGRTASAWARFLDVAGQARAAGQPEREQAAMERAAVLESQLARLKVEVPSTDPRLEVRKDGIALSRTLWGLSVPSDPGTHVIEASAPGKRSVRLEVVLPVGPGEVVASVPQLEAELTSPGPLEPGDPPRAHQSTVGRDPLPPQAVDHHTTERTLGIILGGVGLAGIAMGALFGIRAADRSADASALCTTYDAELGAYTCHDDAEKARHDESVRAAEEARTLAVVSYVVGGAALVGGGILVWTASSSSTNHGPALTAVVGANGVGISLAGALP